MDHDQGSSDNTYHRGILPKFSGVMQTCVEVIPKSFASLFSRMLDSIDKEILVLAEKADSDEMRNRYFETLNEIHLRRLDMEQCFYRSVVKGFENFAAGTVESEKREVPTVKTVKLSLVEKEEHDKSININNIVNNACSHYLDQLFALNRRLAVVNGGTKLGEKNAALPSGPKHICNAFLAATEELDCDSVVIIDLIKIFDKTVIGKSGKIYDDFNSRLSHAGILPNLTADSVIVSEAKERMDGFMGPGGGPNPSSAAPPQPDPSIAAAANFQQPQTGFQQPYSGQPAGYTLTEYTDAAIGQQLYSGISELLMRRHGPPNQPQGGYAQPAPATMPASTLSNLMNELNALQHATAPTIPVQAGPQYQPAIEDIKKTFEEQLAKLTDVVKRESLPASESDIIDLVGMLFEFILDDENMPDSVKALLSHLHTPYLKIALLDRKVFVRNHHPARKLLNAMSQAGARCNPDDPNDLNVVSKISQIVHKVLNDFDENVDVFSDLLEEFSLFMDNFNRRSLLMEKRSVEAAKGRDRLQTARRVVSKEIVDRSIENKIPKTVENLLLGPWANFLVITYLRHGEQSGEWKSSITVTDDLIWSVQPKRNTIEREKLRNLLPKLVDSVRAGLELAGDLEVDMSLIMDQLSKCHKAALAEKKKVTPSEEAKETMESSEISQEVLEESEAPAEKTNEEMQKIREEKVARWKEIIPQEWQEDLEDQTRQDLSQQQGLTVDSEIIKQLKEVELGTWFEFFDKTNNMKQRGKLAWINKNTSNYMFVNQGGRQIAVKSLYNLGKEMQSGVIKMLTIEKAPFISRAFNTIHSKLKKSTNAVSEEKTEPTMD